MTDGISSADRHSRTLTEKDFEDARSNKTDKQSDLLTDKQSDLLSEAYKRYQAYCAEMEPDGFWVVDDIQAHKVLYWFIKDSGLMPV